MKLTIRWKFHIRRMKMNFFSSCQNSVWQETHRLYFPVGLTNPLSLDMDVHLETKTSGWLSKVAWQSRICDVGKFNYLLPVFHIKFDLSKPTHDRSWLASSITMEPDLPKAMRRTDESPALIKFWAHATSVRIARSFGANTLDGLWIKTVLVPLKLWLVTESWARLKGALASELDICNRD